MVRERSGKDVLSIFIGTEQMDLSLIDPEEMQVTGHESEEFVVVASHKEPDVVPFVLIDFRNPAKVGLDRTFPGEPVDERAHRTAVDIAELGDLPKMIRQIVAGDLRGAVCVVLVPTRDRWIIGRQKWCENP